MVRGRRLHDCRFGLLELKQVPHAEVAEARDVNPGHDLTLRVTEKCAVRESENYTLAVDQHLAG